MPDQRLVRTLDGVKGCGIPGHHVIVATKPDEFPGCYASCVDDPEHLADWAAECLLEGATLRRVTCDQAQAMREQYMAWLDAIDAMGAKIECEYVAYPECGCVGRCRYEASSDGKFPKEPE